MTGGGAAYRDRETLRRLYYDVGLTQREMAAELECSRRTIIEWMNRYGLGPGSTTPKHELPRLLYQMDPDVVGDRERRAGRRDSRA